MTAVAIFMGLCVLGMLVLLRFLFAWFKESSMGMGGSYLLKLGERQAETFASHSTAAAAADKASAQAA
jgi:threonine/homoserine/homoserine lactone efflux protein